MLSGKVDKISDKSIVVKTQTGESSRIILAEDEAESLSRVIVMCLRPNRKNEGMVDASGYPIVEGDPIVYPV